MACGVAHYLAGELPPRSTLTLLQWPVDHAQSAEVDELDKEDARGSAR